MHCFTKLPFFAVCPTGGGPRPSLKIVFFIQPCLLLLLKKCSRIAKKNFTMRSPFPSDQIAMQQNRVWGKPDFSHEINSAHVSKRTFGFLRLEMSIPMSEGVKPTLGSLYPLFPDNRVCSKNRNAKLQLSSQRGVRID